MEHAASSTPAGPPAKRLPSLDILRALAILLVIGRHLSLEGSEGLPTALRQALGLWNRVGWAGVDLFFVLSGFLVSGLLFSEHLKFRGIAYLHFVVRRGLKIYPAFYVMIGATLAAGAWSGSGPTARNVWGELLFVQNYVGALWNHTWSLAVEEHFYLAIGVFVALCSRADRVRSVVPAFFLIAVTSLFTRVWLYDRGLALPSELQFQTHTRADALMFGVLLSYAYHFHRAGLQAVVSRYAVGILVLSLGLLAPLFLIDIERGRFGVTYGLTLTYLGFGGIVLLAAFRPAGTRALPARALAAIGAASYSIYLWHVPVRHWFAGSTLPAGLPYGARVAGYVLACLLVGILMAKAVEVPFLKLRDRAFPSRSA
jgi:peptidoglycan/LPS O-acetylase OafA/YrhL